MINYILLVSRQGAPVLQTSSFGSNLAHHWRRESQTRQMVYHHGPEAEGQDRQGRHSAGTGASYEDV